jgi:hypothetical protein
VPNEQQPLGVDLDAGCVQDAPLALGQQPGQQDLIGCEGCQRSQAARL